MYTPPPPPDNDNPLFSESPHEQEVLGTASEYDKYSIEMGTVGWEDDQGLHYDLNTDADDGTTLVKVQLFRGKMPGKTVKPGIAQGHKILAQISGPFWHVPDMGKRVLVAIPGGMEKIPGAAVIVAMPGPAPSNQYTATKSKIDVGPDHDLVVKGKSLTFTDYSNRFVSITADGIVVQDETGSGAVVQAGVVTIFSTNNTVIRLDGTDIQIVNNSGSAIKMDADIHTIGGNNFVMGAGVYLGIHPGMTAISSGAVFATNPAPTPGIPTPAATPPATVTEAMFSSSTVFVAP